MNCPTIFILLILLYIPGAKTCQTCSLSDWYSWSQCSDQCGGGTQSRQRSLCCPREVPYDDCLSGLCRNSVTHQDTFESRKCNTKCSNGGLFNQTCKCLAGWMGKCCELPCREGTYGLDCSQNCKCGNDAGCDTVTGQCNKNESYFPSDGQKCEICELRHWASWSSCTKQCGEGLTSRHREVCCPEKIDYHTCVKETCNLDSSDAKIFQEKPCNVICYNGGIYKDSCQCRPGWMGRCCESSCEDGYYGDRCNSTCTCPKNTKCDTVTGDCLQGANSQRQVTPVRTNLIIGAAVGGFVLVQTFAIVLVFLYKKGQRRTKITEHLDAGKFWPEKSCSNPVLDLSENHYEEIPFDKSQGKAKKISRKNSTEKASNSTQRESFRKGSKKENSFKNKSSMKKESFRKGSKKEDVDGFTRSDMYQFLSENGEDCGYQTLSLDTMKSQAMDNPAMNLYNPGYLSMNGVTNQDTPTTTPEGGYMEMSNQA